MIPKTVKAFLKQLKELSEDTIVSELKGSDKMSEEHQYYLRGIISAIQNELGEMDDSIWEQFKVKPYDGVGSYE